MEQGPDIKLEPILSRRSSRSGLCSGASADRHHLCFSPRGLAKPAHASISCRRFWNKSPGGTPPRPCRSIVCASAISATSRGKFVRSAAQSRKLDRNPWAVRSPRPIRLSTASIAMFESGLPFLPPGNTNSLSRISFICLRIGHRRCRQRHPVLPARLHPRRGYDPNLLFEIDLVPSRADHLAGAGGGQDQELQRPRRDPFLAAQRRDEIGDLVIGQGGWCSTLRTLLRAGSSLSRWPRHRAGFSPFR